MMRSPSSTRGARSRTRSGGVDHDERNGARDGEHGGQVQQGLGTTRHAKLKDESNIESGEPSSDGYAQHRWGDTSGIILAILLIILFSGLAASFSRGAWGACAVAVACVALLSSHRSFFKHFAIPLAAILFVATGVIVLSGIMDLVSERAARMSVESIATDDRWRHWKDGFQTAVKHLPSGSGAGTYGYAQLAEQATDQALWFREAHNQYLEVLEEAGLPGIAIVLSLVFIIFRNASRLLRSAASRELGGWGLAGVFMIIAHACQSVVDFTIKIPGVLFATALILGVVANLGMQFSYDVRKYRDSLKTSDIVLPRRHALFATRMPWCIAATFALWFSYQFVSRDLFAERTLAQTEITDLETAPPPAEIDAALESLSLAIEVNPSKALLYQRRAVWHLQAYRSLLIEQAAAQGSTISWEATSPESILGLSQSLTSAARESLISELRNVSKINGELTSYLRDLRSSAFYNPLVPQVHLNTAAIAIVGGFDQQPILQRAIQLSRNNHHLQFATGLIAYLSNDRELALKQWTSCLATTQVYFEPIMDNSEKIQTPEQILQSLIPDRRSELACTYLQRRVLMRDAPDRLHRLGGIAKDKITADDSLSSNRKNAVLAMCAEALSDWPAAAKYWEMAVKDDSYDVNARYAYTISLIRSNQWDEALKQASLGSGLEPRGVRFGEAAREAERKRRAEAQKMRTQNAQTLRTTNDAKPPDGTSQTFPSPSMTKQ